MHRRESRLGLPLLLVLAAGCGRSGFGPVGDADAGPAAIDAMAGSRADASPCPPRALHFLGDTDGVTIPGGAGAGLGFGPASTIEAWILLDAGSPYGNIFNKFTAGAEDAHLDIGAGAFQASFFTGAATPTQTGAGMVPVGAWTHVATAYDATAWRLFVDGAEVASQGGLDASSSSGLVHLGALFRDPDQIQPIHGFIAEVRMSSSARYTAPFTPEPTLGLDADTQGLWHLDEGAGTTAADVSDKHNDGAISGATWMDAPCR